MLSDFARPYFAQLAKNATKAKKARTGQMTMGMNITNYKGFTIEDGYEDEDLLVTITWDGYGDANCWEKVIEDVETQENEETGEEWSWVAGDVKKEIEWLKARIDLIDPKELAVWSSWDADAWMDGIENKEFGYVNM